MLDAGWINGLAVAQDSKVNGIRDARIAPEIARLRVALISQHVLGIKGDRSFQIGEHAVDVRPGESEAATEMLDRVGLGERLDHKPNELSGGEQQRVTIARALVAEPAIIWADEPTGNLDSETAESVLDLMAEVNSHGQTIVMVTHETDISLYARRIVELRDGLIIRDEHVRDRREARDDLVSGIAV